MILVGHSYGGVVITEAGTDPKVAGLVYVTAFAPDKGESVTPSSPTRRPARPCRRSCRRRTATCFSTGPSSPPPSRATSIRRRSFHGRLPGTVGNRRPRWRDHGAGLEVQAQLVSPRPRRQDDPYPAQQLMAKRAGATVVEVPGSHAIYVSQPQRCRRPDRTGGRRCETALHGSCAPTRLPVPFRFSALW